ncbi:MAG: hypothetical protein QXT26_08635 [Thermoproteota archaeon]
MVRVKAVEALKNRGVRSPRARLCIDVDLADKVTGEELRGWDTVYRLVRALYQYSFIYREVKRTKHGLHVYFNINVRELGCDKLYILKVLFGDDEQRVLLDESRCVNSYWVNVCFSSSEV